MSLIALDWGTTNLRASLLGAQGELLGSRAAAGGVMAVKDRRFADVLKAVCGDWIEQHAVPMIASGMIGSRQGWQEVPYLDCPARIEQVAGCLVRMDISPGVALHIVPGLVCHGEDGVVDVMRGEETQLWGAAVAAGGCCVLPGTHSKWAWMGAEGSIERFSTYMTGELYAVLTQHSILGRLMQPHVPGADHANAGAFETDAFEAGVRLGIAQHAHASHVLFAARTVGLMGEWSASALPDYLSGLLIGLECGSALSKARPSSLTLLGDAVLGERYAHALRIAGLATTRAAEDATTNGLWQVAVHAGLVKAPA